MKKVPTGPGATVDTVCSTQTSTERCPVRVGQYRCIMHSFPIPITELAGCSVGSKDPVNVPNEVYTVPRYAR